MDIRLLMHESTGYSASAVASLMNVIDTHTQIPAIEIGMKTRNVGSGSKIFFFLLVLPSQHDFLTAPDVGTSPDMFRESRASQTE